MCCQKEFKARAEARPRRTFISAVSRESKAGGLWRSSYYYKSRANDVRPLLTRLKDLAAFLPRFGYKRLWLMLRREGLVVNHKRIYRLYKLLGLQLRYKNKKKRPSHARVPIDKPQELN